jgi:hypothetical protein
MDTELVPHAEDWRDKYIAWIDRGELPTDRSGARRITRIAKSFTLVDGELYKCTASGVFSGAYPFLRGASSFETFTRACAATTRRRAPLWTTHSARASIGPPRLLMPARSCTPARGANFTPAKLTSQHTPSRRSPSHGLLLCGGWTLSGPCERRPGATPTCWLRPITNLRAEQAVTFFTDIIYMFGVPSSISTPTNQWSSGAGQRHDFARPQAQNFRQTEQVRPKMAPGTTDSRVELQNHPK